MPIMLDRLLGRTRPPAGRPQQPAPDDPLRRFAEGARDGAGRPIPLAATTIAVRLRGALATVTTTRVFRNAEPQAIEAVLTWPVPVDAVAHGLVVRIDGRTLTGVAASRTEARESYESALDAGRTAILHEEALKGVHVLSVGQIPPGGEVAVETIWSKPLSFHGQAPTLRVPTTVGEVYGRSPLDPVDDLVVGDVPVPVAALTVEAAGCLAHLRGATLRGGAATVPLDRPIDLTFTGLADAHAEGCLADGRTATLSFGPAAADGALRLAILVDRSGSTAQTVGGERGICVLDASRLALRGALSKAGGADRFAVWQFDDHVQRLGAGGAEEAIRLLDAIGRPGGGTEIGVAVAQAATDPAVTDILVLTDGKSYALPVHELSACGKRVSAVLIGEDSLDALIGHLCALTGGQVLVASGSDAADATEAAFAAARRETAPPRGAACATLPPSFVEVRGGTRVAVEIAGAAGNALPEGAVDPVGAYVAALALPRLSERAAEAAALAHGLVTHLTSLLVVDREGSLQQGVPDQRKVALPSPHAAAAVAAPSPPPPPAGWAAPAAAPAMPQRRAALAPPPCGAPAAAAPEAVDSSPVNFRECAARIDWDGNASRLALGRIEGLPAGTRAEILEGATLVGDLAGALGIDATLLVIGMLARVAGGRGAARIARRLLAGIDEAALERVAAVLGL